MDNIIKLRLDETQQAHFIKSIMLSGEQKTVTILFGPTQYGKSTFLDKLLHQNEEVRPKTRTGKGHSITRSIHLYRGTLIGPVLDVPGWNDTGLLVDVAAIAKQVALVLAEGNISNVKILLFDSVKESSVQIRPSLEQLVQAFGKQVKDSIVVLASKFDRADEDEIEDRIATMEKTMTGCKIGNKLVPWKSKNLSESEWFEQLGELCSALDETKPTTLDDIQDIHSRVLERAKKLHMNQKPEMIEHEFTTTEPHIVERIEKEEYEKTEWREVKVADSNMLIDKNVGAGIATYVLSLGIGFAIDAALHGGRPVYEMRPRKVMKQREVTRYETVNQTVTKKIRVPQLKPVSDFIEKARFEIFRETRDELSEFSFVE